MSLINDALRRANSDKSRGPQSAAPVPPMQPVEPRPASPRILTWAVVVAGVGVLAIAAALWFRPRNTAQQLVVRNDEAASSIPGLAPATATTIESTTPPSTPSATAAPERITPEPRSSQPPQTLTAAPSQSAEPSKNIPEHSPVQSAQATSITPSGTVAAKTPEEPPALTRPPAETKPAEIKIAAAAPAQSESTTIPREPAQAQAPRLQAIYYRFRKPTIVINGKTLAPGQSVDGIKVVSIQRTSVEVVHDGKYRTLTLQD